MPIARLVTRTPEFAQRLAQSLVSAGYSVEFVSPEESALSPADLEVNLDDPSAASSYLVTQDGAEICFAYDPIEREFILAPAWRKVKAAFTPLFARFASAERPADASVAAVPVAEAIAPPRPVPEPVPPVAFAKPVTAAIPDEGPEPTTVPHAPPAVSLYLPAPIVQEEIPEKIAVEFSGVEFFDGQGQRRSVAHSAPTTTPPLASVETAKEAPPITEQTSAPEPPKTPWLVIAAERLKAMRAALAAKWMGMRIAFPSPRGLRESGLREYDASWLRAAPVAALLVIAFLLGWGYSGAQRSVPAKPAPGAALELDQAAVLPTPEPPQASPVRTQAQPAAPKRPVRRQVDEFEEDEDVAGDVVVRHYPRHYPSKGERAANEKTPVKRFSDID